MNKHEWLDMKKFTWMNWNAGVKMNKLNRMNWNEQIGMHELKWTTWNEWIEMNELKLLDWHEWVEFNELKLMDWHEWVEMNELPKVVRNPLFFTFLMWNRALATVSCTFCRPHLPKGLRDRQFFTIFKWKSSSCYSLLQVFSDLNLPKLLRHRQFLQFCALFVGNFPRSSRETAETETLLPRPRKPLYPKKHLVLRPRVFSSLKSRVPHLFHFPTIWWWCGCHAGEKAGHDNRP